MNYINRGASLIATNPAESIKLIKKGIKFGLKIQLDGTTLVWHTMHAKKLKRASKPTD